MQNNFQMDLSLILSVVVGVVFALWLEKVGGRAILAEGIGENGADIAVGAAGVFGSLLGFAIAVITFMFAIVDREYFSILRMSKQYRNHWLVFIRASRGYAYATISSLVCAALSGLRPFPAILAGILAAIYMLAATRTVLVLWVIERMIAAEINQGRLQRERHDENGLRDRG